MASLPRFNGMINIPQGRRVADGTLWTLVAWKVLAVDASNADLANDNLATVGLAVARCGHVVGSGTKGFYAVSAEEAMKRRKNVVVLWKR